MNTIHQAGRMRPSGGRRAAEGPSRRGLALLAAAAAIAVMVQSVMADVKVRSDFDKAFDFQPIRTWAWTPEGPGVVVLARTPDDDPADFKKRAEPLILKAVAAEMPRRGLTLAAGTPDVTLTYYLLLTLGSSAQTLGQFLPATGEWGLPPFTSSTQSFEMIQQGSLVLDLSANRQVVWRGIAQAKIKMDLAEEKRAALIGEAVREILKRYPPKPKK